MIRPNLDVATGTNGPDLFHDWKRGNRDDIVENLTFEEGKGDDVVALVSGFQGRNERRHVDGGD